MYTTAATTAPLLGMPSNRVITVRTGDDTVSAETLREGIAAIQAEMKVTPEFPEAVERAAAEAAASPRMPDLDRTDVPFVIGQPPDVVGADLSEVADAILDIDEPRP